MKKIVLVMAFAMAMLGSAAQSATDDFYLGLRGGASGLLHPGCNGYENFGHTIQGQASVQFGKWITPKVAFGIESTVGFENGSSRGAFLGKNWINYVDVLAVSKFNMNNIIRGYRGTADKFEVVPTVGIGWVHGFTYSGHSNDIMTKYAVDLNCNMNKHIQLSISPYIAYNLTGGYQGTNAPRFDARNAWWGAEVGVTYKFGNGFTKCEPYPTELIDGLNQTINELRAAQPEVKVVEKVVEKKVETVVEKNIYQDIVIDFKNNSSVLDGRESAKLRGIPREATVEVIGSATKWGSEARNDELSKGRADVVADFIRQMGVKNVTSRSVGTKYNERVAIVKISCD